MARKRPSIIKQTLMRLDELKRFGQSKHLAKQEERERSIERGEKYNPARVDGIYSYKTYAVYKEHSLKFVTWAREKHGSRTLEQAREHVREYLQEHIRDGRSAWTVRVEAAALAKLYGCSSNSFGVELPSRRREDIHRSREEREQNRVVEENRDLLNFVGDGLEEELSVSDLRTLYKKVKVYKGKERWKGTGFAGCRGI